MAKFIGLIGMAGRSLVSSVNGNCTFSGFPADNSVENRRQESKPFNPMSE
jgi:hypothetical protein